jgi:hypothetical protein
MPYLNMSTQKLSEEQLDAIETLRDAINKWQHLQIHISGVSEFEVSLNQDIAGNEFASIS